METYLVPEKSTKISQPPAKVKTLTKEGLIVYEKVPSNALINRTTSEWYKDVLRVDLEWRLGLIDILSDDWDMAMKHFDQVRLYDEVINKAEKNKFFNAYHRVKAARKHESLIGTTEQLNGLKTKVRILIMWADLNFVNEDFQRAEALYSKIAFKAKNQKKEYAYTRGFLGKMLCKRETVGLDPVKDVKNISKVLDETKKTPSDPFLLEICASITGRDKKVQQKYFSKNI